MEALMSHAQTNSKLLRKGTWIHQLLPCYMQPLFNAIYTIRDLPEIVPPTALLRLVENRMVRGNHLSRRMMRDYLATTPAMQCTTR